MSLRSQAVRHVTNLLDLLSVMGKLSEPGCGLAPLAEENNDQGAVEMGAVAELLPGAIELTDPPTAATIGRAWQEEFPQSPGAPLIDMLDRPARAH